MRVVGAQAVVEGGGSVHDKCCLFYFGALFPSRGCSLYTLLVPDSVWSLSMCGAICGGAYVEIDIYIYTFISV
jgi:hypothetical protein